MKNLLKKKCISCENKEIKPFSRTEAKNYLNKISGWNIDKKEIKISKEFKFKKFY